MINKIITWINEVFLEEILLLDTKVSKFIFVIFFPIAAACALFLSILILMCIWEAPVVSLGLLSFYVICWKFVIRDKKKIP